LPKSLNLITFSSTYLYFSNIPDNIFSIGINFTGNDEINDLAIHIKSIHLINGSEKLIKKIPFGCKIYDKYGVHILDKF
jgi:hypothetical protein